jgi:ferredoxin
MGGTLLWCAQPSGKGAVVKVRVDPEKCQGHNRCYSLAPELFDVDDFGYATAAGQGVVPPELEDKAKLAAANCPEYAVLLEDEG